MSEMSIPENATAVQPPTQDGPREKFLALLSNERRGVIVNFFVSAVRTGGAATPEAVTRYVLSNLYQRLDNAHHWGNQTEEERLVPYIDIVQGERELALGFAAWALAWCALPERERARVKRKRSDHYRIAWMGERPPSEAQLKYISGLGWRGDPPTSMLEASQLIERLKGQREAVMA